MIGMETKSSKKPSFKNPNTMLYTPSIKAIADAISCGWYVESVPKDAMMFAVRRPIRDVGPVDRSVDSPSVSLNA